MTDRSEQPPRREPKLKRAVAGGRRRVDEGREWLTRTRQRFTLVDVAFLTAERDHARGGGLIAGALAYRLFFWLLPVALLVVAGLGFLSSADKSAPKDLAESVGSFGFAAQSVADAAGQAERSRWWALGIGLPALYFASVSFVKALYIANSLLWDMPARRLRRKAVGAAVMMGFLLAIIVVVALEARIRDGWPAGGLVAAAVFMVFMGGLWLVISLRLPHPPAIGWRDLLPGAVLVAAGVQAVHLVTVYYLASRLERASTAYGGLGTATAMLVSLFLLARVGVVSVSLNVELWERGQPRAR